MADPPSLLLTKRLTSFLRNNLSAHITSALLLTPSGKLLSYASNPPQPVSVLRTQGTVVASLWAIHTSGSNRDAIAGALARPYDSLPDAANPSGPTAITTQLESGNVVVIRKLRCGLLFVCFGPAAVPGSDGAAARQRGQTNTISQILEPQQHTAGDRTPERQVGNTNGVLATPTNSHGPTSAASSPPLGSPSEAASVLSGAATLGSTATTSSFGGGVSTAGAMATRRNVEEVARWLDDKLGNLTLPEEGIGVA